MIISNLTIFGREYGGPSLLPETQAILNYATSQGWTLPSGPTTLVIDTYIGDLILYGLWNKHDVIYNFAYNDNTLSDFARINWKSPGSFTIQHQVSTVFYNNNGFQGNASNYLDTTFIPAIDGFQYTQNQASRSFVIAFDASFGNGYEGNSNLSNIVFKSDSTLQRINSSNNLNTSFNMGGIGFKSIIRDDSANVRLANLGTIVGRTQTSTTLPTVPQLILRFGASSCNATFSNYMMGTNINNVELGYLRTLYNTFLTSIGLTAFA